jgi:hypothetical protein
VEFPFGEVEALYLKESAESGLFEDIAANLHEDQSAAVVAAVELVATHRKVLAQAVATGNQGMVAADMVGLQQLVNRYVT